MPSDRSTAQIAKLRRKLEGAQTALKAAAAETARLKAALAVQGITDDEPPMTEAEIRHLHALFTPSPPGGPACPDCGRLHPGPCQTCAGIHPGRACPRVRSIEYQSQGDRVIIRKVTYWEKWDASGIIFADELPEMPGEA